VGYDFLVLFEKLLFVWKLLGFEWVLKFLMVLGC